LLRDNGKGGLNVEKKFQRPCISIEMRSRMPKYRWT